MSEKGGDQLRGMPSLPQNATAERRRALSSCLAHFQSWQETYRVLRLIWEHPHPSCLNTAEINRLTAGLGRGPVFGTEEIGGGVTELRVNHPATDAPALFSVKDPGRREVGVTEYMRQAAATNLSAWLELTTKTTAAAIPPPTDGGINDDDGRIWLRGAWRKLPAGLRRLLCYLLTSNPAGAAAVRRHCGYTDNQHLQKRLSDLRRELKRLLRGSGWDLHVRTDEGRVITTWTERERA